MLRKNSAQRTLLWSGLLVAIACGGSYSVRTESGGDTADTGGAAYAEYGGDGASEEMAPPSEPMPADTAAGGEAPTVPTVASAPPPQQQARTQTETSTDTYADDQEAGFVDAAQDAMVTFSLDVDTASYTRMRREINGGGLPDPRSVRPEEYLNFFRFDQALEGQHAHRHEGAPFTTSLESGPSPFGGEGMRLLRVGVRADAMDQGQRPPANLVFLVDVSGSMASQGKLDLVKFSLETLVDSLRPDDTVGIVVYAGRVGTLIEPTRVENRGLLLEAIRGLTAGGSTNGEGGIRHAYDLAKQHFRRGGINRVVLATDGDFNVGLTGNSLIELIEEYRERDITLTTLGFGRGNDRDLERLADHGNGNYAFVDSQNEALRVLARDLQGTLQVVAKDVKIQVAMNDAVVDRFRLIGYENRRLAHRDFADDRVDAAEVGSGHFVTALIEYRLKPNVRVTDGRELAEVRVRYKKPDGRRSRLTTQSFRVSDGESRLSQTSPTFRFTAAVAELAEVLRHSEHSNQTDLEAVARLADDALERWPGQWQDGQEFVRLVRRAAQLQR